MSEKKVIKLIQNPMGFGEVADEVEAHASGSPLPTQHTHSYYEDEALGLYIGVWDTTDMIETAGPYSCEEFMSIIEGAVEIKNSKTGKMETVMAGESFVIPREYDCQWHQNGYLRKYYVIFEPEEAPSKPVTENVIYIDENNATPWHSTSDGHNKKVLYQNHNQTFTSGIWQSKGFNTDTITFPYNEFITVKQGSLSCIDKDGVEHKVSAGEALFIPEGVCCSWQAQEKITLHFAQIKQS